MDLRGKLRKEVGCDWAYGIAKKDTLPLTTRWNAKGKKFCLGRFGETAPYFLNGKGGGGERGLTIVKRAGEARGERKSIPHHLEKNWSRLKKEGEA